MYQSSCWLYFAVSIFILFKQDYAQFLNKLVFKLKINFDHNLLVVISVNARGSELICLEFA